MDNVTDITMRLGVVATQIQENPESDLLKLIERALKLRLEYLLSSVRQQAA